MPQSLLAILALGLITLLSLNVQSQRVDELMAHIGSEVEMGAREAAADLMDHLANRPFEPGEPASSFGIGATSLHDVNLESMNDYHGMRGVPMQRWITTSDSGELKTITYDVDIDVFYVTRTGNVVTLSLVPTLTKEVVVSVTHDLMRSPVVLNRIVTPME
jgi:hypothetical protein